jgi:chromosome partitioning protein
LQNTEHTATNIVFGNNKRHAGKTLTLAHLAIGLMAQNFRVCTIDLDDDNESLSLFLHRRHKFDNQLSQPHHIRIPCVGHDEPALIKILKEQVDRINSSYDFIVIDTARSDNPASRAAHQIAHIILSPVQEQELSSLATLKPNSSRIETPSNYVQMLENFAMARLERKEPPATWFVMRARHTQRNLNDVSQDVDLFDKLSSELGFIPVTGLTEKSHYHEDFANGLTSFDKRENLTTAQIMARQEVRHVIQQIWSTTQWGQNNKQATQLRGSSQLIKKLKLEHSNTSKLENETTALKKSAAHALLSAKEHGQKARPEQADGASLQTPTNQKFSRPIAPPPNNKKAL